MKFMFLIPIAIGVVFAGFIVGETFGYRPTCDVSKLTMGITAEEAVALCGRPRKINGDNYGEQWVYDGSRNYLYFKGGKLDAAQWQK